MNEDFKKYLSEKINLKEFKLPKFEYNTEIKLVLEADEETTADEPPSKDTDTSSEDLNPPDDLDSNSGGGDLFGNEDFGKESSNNDNGNTEKTSEVKEEEDKHEDDPEFSAGSTDGTDITITDKAPSSVLINFDNINTALDDYAKIAQNDTLITTIAELKNVNNWLSKGKKLLMDDVKFSDPKMLKVALKYIKSKIKLNDFNYFQKKIKEPLNVDMAKQKEEIAKNTTNKNSNVDNLIAVSSI